MNHPIHCGPSEGRNYDVWGDLYSFKTVSADNGGTHALLEMTVSSGSGTPPHIHGAEAEMFYILEGELSLWLGEEKIAGRPGSFVAIPRGTVHRIANESGAPAKALVFIVPGGFEEFLMKLGTPAGEGTQPSGPPTKEQIEFAMSIAADYHLEFVK